MERNFEMPAGLSPLSRFQWRVNLRD